MEKKPDDDKSAKTTVPESLQVKHRSTTSRHGALVDCIQESFMAAELYACVDTVRLNDGSWSHTVDVECTRLEFRQHMHDGHLRYFAQLTAWNPAYLERPQVWMAWIEYRLFFDSSRKWTDPVDTAEYA